MAKKIVGLHQAAGAGRQGEPVAADRPGAGPARPQHHGVLQAFNAATQGLEPGMPIPVVITAFADRTFTFVTKTPPASYFLKRAAGPGEGRRDAGPHAPPARSRWRRCARSPSRR